MLSKQTGDPSLQLSKLLAKLRRNTPTDLLTAQGLSMTKGLPSGTVEELTKKTLASASIGGAAVAASGGEEEDIVEGFVKGAALTAAREYYSSMTEEQIEGRAPSKGAIPKPKLDPSVRHEFKILVDGNGEPIKDATGKYHQIDIRSLPKDASHVGLAGTDPSRSSFRSGSFTPDACRCNDALHE